MRPAATGAKQHRCRGGDLDQTGGRRATTTIAALLLAAGTTTVLYGVVRDDLARSISGACLLMTGLALIILVSVRRWTSDTQAERLRLSDATREADAERMRYVAAQAALEVERQRVQRDAAAERHQLTARLHAERVAMRDTYEDERARLIAESFETAVQLVRAGVLDEPKGGHTANHAKVIGLFPTPEMPGAEQHRARERGSVGP